MRSGREAGQDLMWHGRVVYGTADKIKYRFGYVEPITPHQHQSWVAHRYGRDTAQHSTAKRSTGTRRIRNRRPAPLDADANQ